MALARPLAIDALRLQHIAAELADDFAWPAGPAVAHLRIGVADAPLVIDRVYALDDAAEHGLGFGLAPPQRIGQVDQIAPHLVHRARERADLQRRHGRQRGGKKIAAADALGQIAQRDHRTGEPAPVQHAGQAGDRPRRAALSGSSM